MSRRSARRTAAVAALALLAAALLSLTGCSTVGYYAQAVNGHLGLLESARPVSEWLADPATPAALKQRLELSQRIRDYSVAVLKEPDNASYRRYADLHRAAAVWNVVAAPELSLELQTWCFPLVGCVSYRGYFDRAAADRFAAGLRAQGLDVSVYGVPAYSTLGALPERGWFADPLLNTFIDYPEGELARLIFHELAHQVAYAKGDTVFNESFATAVERIGGAAWLRGPCERRRRATSSTRLESRRRDFRALTMDYRGRFDALYKSDASDTEKRAGKAALLAQLQVDYQRMKTDALARLCRLRRVVRARQQRVVRRAGRLHRTGAELRTVVRTRGPRLRALLRRGQAAGRAAARRAARGARAIARFKSGSLDCGDPGPSCVHRGLSLQGDPANAVAAAADHGLRDGMTWRLSTPGHFSDSTRSM